MTTLRELIENPDLVGAKHGTDLDIEIYVVDPQNEDDGAYPLALEYDLPVTVTHGAYGDENQHKQVILLRVREDYDAVIVHD